MSSATGPYSGCSGVWRHRGSTAVAATAARNRRPAFRVVTASTRSSGSLPHARLLRAPRATTCAGSLRLARSLLRRKVRAVRLDHQRLERQSCGDAAAVTRSSDRSPSRRSETRKPISTYFWACSQVPPKQCMTPGMARPARQRACSAYGARWTAMASSAERECTDTGLPHAQQRSRAVHRATFAAVRWGRVVAVEVEADLPDRDDFRQPRERFQFGQHRRGHVVGVVRVEADRREEQRRVRGQFEGQRGSKTGRSRGPRCLQDRRHGRGRCMPSKFVEAPGPGGGCAYRTPGSCARTLRARSRSSRKADAPAPVYVPPGTAVVLPSAVGGPSPSMAEVLVQLGGRERQDGVKQRLQCVDHVEGRRRASPRRGRVSVFTAFHGARSSRYLFADCASRSASWSRAAEVAGVELARPRRRTPPEHRAG